MRITPPNSRTYSVHFKSLFSFEIPWQVLCLAAAFLIISVMLSSAQPAEETVNPSTPTVAEFNIVQTIQTLGEQFCKDDDKVNLEACSVPMEAGEFDPRDTVAEARAWTMDRLIRADAEETATLARIQVLRLQIAEEQLREELLQLQQKNGAVYSADEFAEAMGGLESLDHGLMTLEDDLAQTNDYTSDLNDRIKLLEGN